VRSGDVVVKMDASLAAYALDSRRDGYGGGRLVCNADSMLTMAGAYTQLGGSGAGRLSVEGVTAWTAP
jgi:hypothetical protein